MFTTFITTIKVLIRDRSVLLWAVAFPLVLTTLFYAMFSNLDEVYVLDPIPVIVVEDEHYTNAETFTELIDSLAKTDINNGNALFAPLFVANEAAALEALNEGAYRGYIMVDADGTPSYVMDMRRQDAVGEPYQTIIMSVLDQYIQNVDLITSLIEQNPTLLMQEGFIENLVEGDSLSHTTRVSVTANPPSDALRYFYAVLAFSTIMMSTFALTAIDAILGNTSPLGARRSLGGQSKVRMLVPTLTATWLLSFVCVMIGFLYQLLVFGIDFGGKEAAVVLVLAVSSLAATFLGALLGSLPVASGLKNGLVALFSCALSLFAGLYGPFSQDLGDMVARELPWLSAANPVRQVADAFFSLYHYDGYEAMSLNLIALLIFSAVFFILSTLIIRRQRYASL